MSGGTHHETFRHIVAIVVSTPFAFSGVAFAAGTYYVAEDTAGKMAVVDKKPGDARMIVKGPFIFTDEARKASKVAEKGNK